MRKLWLVVLIGLLLSLGAVGAEADDFLLCPGLAQDLRDALEDMSRNQPLPEQAISDPLIFTSVPANSGRSFGIAAAEVNKLRMLLFGDVRVSLSGGAQGQAEGVDITLAGGVNLRGSPSTQSAVLRVTQGDTTVHLTGQTADGTWFLVNLEDGTLAWVSVQVMNSTARTLAANLPVVAADQTAVGGRGYNLQVEFNPNLTAECHNVSALVLNAPNLTVGLNGREFGINGIVALTPATNPAGIFINLLDGNMLYTVNGSEQTFSAQGQTFGFNTDSTNLFSNYRTGFTTAEQESVTNDVIALLETLRKLQDLQVTTEVRFITVNDTFFERIGIDFDFAFGDRNNPDPAVAAQRFDAARALFPALSPEFQAALDAAGGTSVTMTVDTAPAEEQAQQSDTSQTSAQVAFTPYLLYLDGLGDHVDPNTKQAIPGLTGSFPDIDYTTVLRTDESTEISMAIASASANYAGGFSLAYANGSIRYFGWVTQNGVVGQAGEFVNNQLQPGTEPLFNIRSDPGNDSITLTSVTVTDQPAAFGGYVCDFSVATRLVCDEDHPFTAGNAATYQQIPPPELFEAVQTVLQAPDSATVTAEEAKFYEFEDILTCIALIQTGGFSADVLLEYVTVGEVQEQDEPNKRFLKVDFSDGLQEAFDELGSSPFFYMTTHNANGNPVRELMFKYSVSQTGIPFYVVGLRQADGSYLTSEQSMYYFGLLLELRQDEVDFKLTTRRPSDNPAFFAPGEECPTANVM